MSDRMEPQELAGALKRLADWATEHAPKPESPVLRLLRRHFGADPADMPSRAPELEATRDEVLIEALEGVSPAFIRELLRRAALIAAETSDGTLRVGEQLLHRALRDLRDGSGQLTNVLLGARRPTDRDP